MNFNYWGWQTALATVGLGVCGAAYLKQRSKILALNFLWAAFSFIRVFAWPDSPYAGNGPVWIMQFDLASARGLAEFMGIALSAILLSGKQWAVIWRIVAALNALLIIGGAFVHMPFGLLVNASMSGCLAATMLPVLPPLEMLLSVVAVLLTARHMSYACLGAMGLVYILRSKYWKLGLLALPTAPFFIAKFFDSNGRSDTWSLAWDFYKTHGHWLFGYGGGSFAVIGPFLTKPSGALWFWLHSDWFQILFEQGVVGALLIVALFLQLAFRAKGRVFYVLISYGVWALANMPLRYPVGAMCGAVLIRWAFAAEDSQTFEASYRWRPSFQASRQKFARLFDRSSEEYRPESEQVSTRS